MDSPRLYPRLYRPSVEIDSPLMECRLLDLSTAGIGIETGIGLRLGVPYPFRLRDGEQTLGTEAVVRWCRWVRNESVEGELRPVYRAGASFVDWRIPEPERKVAGIERQIDGGIEQQIGDAIDGWIEQSRNGVLGNASKRTIVHRAPRR